MTPIDPETTVAQESSNGSGQAPGSGSAPASQPSPGEGPGTAANTSGESPAPEPSADGRQAQAQAGAGQAAAGRGPSAPGGAAEGAGGAAAGPLAGDSSGEALDGDLRELVAVAAQRDEYLALAQRTQADFENYRKRVARDAQAAHDRGLSKLARELLPAVDNLDRALLEAGGGDGRPDGLLEGLRLVRTQLGDALARVGIEEFSALGEPFDPTLHEAMAQAPAPEGAASGTVIEVYQPGYRLGESVIRPARVVVAA